MHQIRFLGELTALPRPSSWIQGVLLLREGRGKGEKGRGKGEGAGRGVRGRGVLGHGCWGIDASGVGVIQGLTESGCSQAEYNRKNRCIFLLSWRVDVSKNPQILERSSTSEIHSL